VGFAAWPLRDQVGAVIPAGSSRRIVTLAPDVTELVFALGAGRHLVAVAPFSDFPPAAAALPRVAVSDPEAIVAARPDLVLASTAGNDPAVVTALRRVGVRVATVDVTSCARLAEACLLLGQLVAAAETGQRLAADITSHCDAARRRAADLPRRTALYVAWWDPLMVAGPGTVHHDLLALAGLDNRAPARGGRYPRVDPEVLLDPALQVLVAPADPDSRPLVDALLRRPAGLRLRRGTLPLIWLPADPASRPGPRLLLALDVLLAAREAAP